MSRGPERGDAATLQPLDRAAAEVSGFGSDEHAGRQLHREKGEVRYGRQIYTWSELDRTVMTEIGKFRTLDEDDIRRTFYGGLERPFRYDHQSLSKQGLIQHRSITVGQKRQVRHVVVLTKRGKRLLQRQDTDNNHQALYAGFVKPSEASHDASIYRMYEVESARLRSSGNLIRRVVLDFEFKKKIYSELNRAGDYGSAVYQQRQADLAELHKLPIVDGKITLPDLRIEYEQPDGSHEHIDLELATEHYRRAHMRSKLAAGFKLYGTNSTSRGRRADWEGRELTAAVLAL